MAKRGGTVLTEVRLRGSFLARIRDRDVSLRPSSIKTPLLAATRSLPAGRIGDSSLPKQRSMASATSRLSFHQRGVFADGAWTIFFCLVASVVRLAAAGRGCLEGGTFEGQLLTKKKV